jgi:7,8-dihydroneopterin aldolase/epimerase/oxygenase
MDRISLRNVRAYGKHGVFPHERERAAPFDVDVTIDADLHAAAASDDLNDTLDYAAIHAAIVRIVERTSFALLERLAGELAGAVLADARVVAVEITIAKPGILDGATPAVTLRRSR